MISLALGEELLKFFKDSCSMDLIWVRLCIEYLLGHVDGVSNDDDFRYIFFVASLIKSTSNHKKFRFSAGDVGHIVVATTRHSRTNDLTTSKALQWAIK